MMATSTWPMTPWTIGKSRLAVSSDTLCGLFKIKEITDVPIAADLLDANRTTVVKTVDGKLQVINDLGAEQRFLHFEWTSCTIFQDLWQSSP